MDKASQAFPGVQPPQPAQPQLGPLGTERYNSIEQLRAALVALGPKKETYDKIFKIVGPEKQDSAKPALIEFFSTGSNSALSFLYKMLMDAGLAEPLDPSTVENVMEQHPEIKKDEGKDEETLASLFLPPMEKTAAAGGGASKAYPGYMMGGPDEKRMCPKLRNVVNEYTCRYYCLDGLQIDDGTIICGEAVWRGAMMDKFSREYKNEDGKWVGGYINKRFMVERDDGGHPYQLRPRQRHAPIHEDAWIVEKRLQEMRREGGKERGYSETPGDPKNLYNFDQHDLAKGPQAPNLWSKDKDKLSKLTSTQWGLNKQAQVPEQTQEADSHFVPFDQFKDQYRASKIPPEMVMAWKKALYQYKSFQQKGMVTQAREAERQAVAAMMPIFEKLGINPTSNDPDEMTFQLIQAGVRDVPNLGKHEAQWEEQERQSRFKEDLDIASADDQEWQQQRNASAWSLAKKNTKTVSEEKFVRCKEHVKENSPGVNEYAVCTDSLGGQPASYHKKKKKKDAFNLKEIRTAANFNPRQEPSMYAGDPNKPAMRCSNPRCGKVAGTGEKMCANCGAKLEPYPMGDAQSLTHGIPAPELAIASVTASVRYANGVYSATKDGRMAFGDTAKEALDKLEAPTIQEESGDILNLMQEQKQREQPAPVAPAAPAAPAAQALPPNPMNPTPSTPEVPVDAAQGQPADEIQGGVSEFGPKAPFSPQKPDVHPGELNMYLAKEQAQTPKAEQQRFTQETEKMGLGPE